MSSPDAVVFESVPHHADSSQFIPIIIMISTFFTYVRTPSHLSYLFLPCIFLDCRHEANSDWYGLARRARFLVANTSAASKVFSAMSGEPFLMRYGLGIE